MAIRFMARGVPMDAYSGLASNHFNFDSTHGRSNGIDQCGFRSWFQALTVTVGAGTTLGTFAQGTHVLAGFAIQPPTPTGTAVSPVILLQEGATVHVGLYVDQTGALSVKNGSGTVLATSAAAALAMNGVDWTHLSINAVIDGTVGSVIVQNYGTVVFNLSAVNTRNGGTGVIDTIVWGSAVPPFTGGADWGCQDLWAADTVGSIFNALPSNFQVLALLPSADTAQADFAKNTGTVGYSLINNQDDDTTYLLSNTVGNKSEFAITDTPASPTTGFVGVSFGQRARRDDATARSSQAYLKSGASVHNGTALVLTQSYLNQNDVAETDPATAAAWTKAALDALLWGVTVSA